MPADTMRVALIMLATCAVAACTTTPPASTASSPLARWLVDTAGSTVLAWRDLNGPGTTFRIVPLGISAMGDTPSRLTVEAAEQLRRALQSRGVHAEMALATDLARITQTECRGTAADLVRINVTVDVLSASAGEPAQALITVQAAELSGGPGQSLVSATVVLDTREQPLAVERAIVAPIRGSLAQPYRAEEVDFALANIAAQLRCDLLRVQVRAGAPDLTWDVAAPSPWYESFGRRLRDELVRLDGVQGAPGSPWTLQRIELRAEPAGVDNVLRLVARASSTPSAGGAPVIVWQQAYLRAPGPTNTPPALVGAPPVAAPSVSPRVARVDPPPVPAAVITPPPAQTRRNRVAMGDIRVHTARVLEDCTSNNPWQHGSVVRTDDRPLTTGDCVALEVRGVRGDGLYVLHRDVSGPVTRLAPSSCVPATVQLGRERTFRIPAIKPGAPAIQLTPPSGSEQFYAIALDSSVDASLRAMLDSLPDACGGAQAASATAPGLLGRLEAEASRGRVAWRTLILQHLER